MREPKELESFKASLSRKLASECQHEGPLTASKTQDASVCMCPCKEQYVHQSLAYEACIPKKFWRSTPADVFHNKAVWSKVFENYILNLRTALTKGSGIFLHGPNGVGKTMFFSMLLMHVIRETSASCYYTTAMALDQNLKRTFGNSQAAELRSERIRALTRSHFFVLDEMGKEKLKSGDSWTRRELELILRHREEENLPILIASNRSAEALRAPVEDGGYGETIGSIIDGACQIVPMAPGDQRKEKGKDLNREMGYGRKKK